MADSTVDDGPQPGSGELITPAAPSTMKPVMSSLSGELQPDRARGLQGICQVDGS